MKHKGMEIIKKLATKGDFSLTSDDEELLLSDSDNAILESKEKAGNIYSAIWKGFIRLAVSGEEFTPIETIKEHFGSDLRENYPEANELFLKFAKTYWTYKFALEALHDTSDKWVGLNFLHKIEIDVAALFFPTPGPVKIPHSKREKTQREILKDASINIDEFMNGNPILIRDKTHQKGFFQHIFGT